MKKINIRTLKIEDILTLKVEKGGWDIENLTRGGSNLYMSIRDELYVYNMESAECSRIYTGGYEKTGNYIRKIILTENNVIMKMWHYPKTQEQLIVIDKQTYKPNKVLEVDNGEFLFRKSYIVKVIRKEISDEILAQRKDIWHEKNSPLNPYNIQCVQLYDKQDISFLGTIDMDIEMQSSIDIGKELREPTKNDILILNNKKKIQVWDLYKGCCLNEIPLLRKRSFIEICSKGQIETIGDKLVILSRVYKGVIYDIKTGKQLFNLNIEITEYGEVRIIDERYFLVEALVEEYEFTKKGGSRIIKLVDIEGRKVVREFTEDNKCWDHTSTWYIDNELFVSVSDEGRRMVIREFDTENRPQSSSSADVNQEEKQSRTESEPISDSVLSKREDQKNKKSQETGEATKKKKS